MRDAYGESPHDYPEDYTGLEPRVIAACGCVIAESDPHDAQICEAAQADLLRAMERGRE